MKANVTGVLILVLIVVGVILYKNSSSVKPVELTGFAGGEKTGFLQNETLLKTLLKKYGIRLNWSKAGSMEMLRDNNFKPDFLWPSSEVALEYYKVNQTGLVKSENIFNSPVVLYTWDIVSDALIKDNIVTVRDSIYYVSDMKKLIQYVIDGKKWQDIGLDQLYGQMLIFSTDPNKSNSGAMFAGLLAGILCGDLRSDSTLECVLPKIKSFFNTLGFMEHSSGDLFQQYLSTGVGAKPIIVGYESQIIEFSVQNAKMWPSVKQKLRILYPEPTVWSAHPLIVKNDKAELFRKALLDPEIQKLAWEYHGFRTGAMGIQNSNEMLSVSGVPLQITKVISLPNYKAMQRILAYIAGDSV